MKLAHVMAGAPAGGAELFFERLAMALHRGGDTVLPVIRRNPQRAARLAAAGLVAEQLRFGGPLDLLTGPSLRRILRRFAPRFVMAWMSRAAAFAPQGDWVLTGRLGGYYDLSSFRRCDHLVGNTHDLVRWIAGQGWPADRVHHLPNFADDLARATPVPRASLGVPVEAGLVLALGRLHRNKAFDILVRALPSLPGVHAVIAGEGPERGALEDLARREGVADRLHLPGWRQDSGALLGSADLLVCPSRHEPLGNVVIEAWSARRPVVAAASAGPVELVRPDQDGVIVPLEDPRALADGIAGVLHDPARAAALAAAGRVRFESEFAEAPVLARWHAFMSRVGKR